VLRRCFSFRLRTFDNDNWPGHLERAQRLGAPGITDPEQAQRNRVERDRILAVEVLDRATDLGLPTLIIDGTSGPAAITETVEEQFRPFLDEWLY
jgi:hypothetical protein